MVWSEHGDRGVFGECSGFMENPWRKRPSSLSCPADGQCAGGTSEDKCYYVQLRDRGILPRRDGNAIAGIGPVAILEKEVQRGLAPDARTYLTRLPLVGSMKRIAGLIWSDRHAPWNAKSLCCLVRGRRLPADGHRGLAIP